MKYFVISDIHGFYTEMMQALDDAGFDINNPEHALVSCGDLFDRGSENKKVLEFVMSVPEERRFLVWGNHDENLWEIINLGRGLYEADMHNGTVKTIKELAGIGNNMFDCVEKLRHDQMLQEYFACLKNCFETEHYIFVHGWLPTYQRDGQLCYCLDADDREEWKSARWRCGFSCWYDQMYGVVTSEYTIADIRTVVCGHWHTSYAHRRFHSMGKEFPDKYQSWKKHCHFEPFADKGIIGIDGCTAYTGKVNVLVIDEPSGEATYEKTYECRMFE